MNLKRTFKTAFIVILGVSLLLLTFIWKNSYLILSFGLVLVTVCVFFLRFEQRRVEPRELVLLAVLAAVAAAARIPFAAIPNVQPTTFVIMMSGYVFGAESGFMIGAVAALASNMLLGQGPWTPWQMMAWGLVGLTAGMFRRFLVHWWGKIIFGFVWAYLFGVIMNMWGILSLGGSGTPLTLKAILIYFGASLTFDTFHAVSNLVFIVVFGNTWIKILTRFKVKYGLLED